MIVGGKMNQERDIYKQAEKEYQELNNELVIPSYRRFCKELNLQFHFWDELLKDSYNSEISLAEFPLHNEAMDLFNRLKPEVVIFKDKVIRYQFTNWNGDFTYDSWPIQEYFDKVSDELFYLKNLEKRYKSVSTRLVFVISILAFIVTTLLLLMLLSWKLAIGLGFILGGAVYYFLTHYINKKIPQRIIDDGRLIGVVEQINKLRKQITRINNSHLNS